MKAIKILTFVIIGILIIGIGVGAYIYFYTDTFKTNKEIFYKYASKEQLEKIIDFDSINQTLTRLKSEKSEQNIDATINMTMDDQNVLNNATISLKGKTDPTENKSEISLAFGNENKKDVLQIDGIYNKEKVGISFKDITNKYVALENKNLNQFWEKLGLNGLDMDKIEFSNYDSQIDKNIEKAKAVVTEFFTKIAEQTSKEQYSNLGKTRIELNGAAVEAKAYELKLNNEEIKNICASINTGDSDTNEFIDNFKQSIENSKFNFSQTIYIYEEKLAMIEIKIEGEDYQAKVAKEIGTQNDNLTIQIITPDKQQVTIDILTALTNENEKCTINFEILGNEDDEYKFSANVNMDVKFNAEDTIKELTDKNSVVINDKSKEEIEQIVETATKLLQEKEGLEDTVLGIFMEMNASLFNKSIDAVENASSAMEEEQQLLQRSEQVAEMTNSTNN